LPPRSGIGWNGGLGRNGPTPSMKTVTHQFTHQLADALFSA
jgi:hypothetical protein